MAEAVYPAATREIADKRRALAPETEKTSVVQRSSWRDFKASRMTRLRAGIV
ncbi:MAG: hypothetical protein WBO09_02335 [Methylocystis silviterrae]|uniref:hypothetical protein n=1 Tax=Methylocystis silviterrae TaxID=2743612 RepID=UPI003C78C483